MWAPVCPRHPLEFGEASFPSSNDIVQAHLPCPQTQNQLFSRDPSFPGVEKELCVTTFGGGGEGGLVTAFWVLWTITAH